MVQPELPWRAVVVSEDETLVDAQLTPSVFGMHVRMSPSNDGSVLLRVGNIRARYRDGAMAFAHESTFRPIVTSAPDGDQWLFATADGALFSAPDFLGPLTRLSETSGMALDMEYVSRGVLLSADPSGSVWMGGVDVPFARAEIPAFGPPMDLAFSDRRFGAAILSPGTLLRTTNGGRSFESVDLGTEAAFAVLPDADGIAVDTSTGWMHLGATGGAIARARAIVSPPAIVDPLETIRREFLRQRGDALETIVAHANCSPYRGGCIVLEGEDVRFIARNGETTHFPLPPTEANTPRNAICRSATLNDVIYLNCQRTPDQSVLYAWDSGRWIEARRYPTNSRLHVARLGGSFSLSGSCDNDPARADTSWCWFDGHRWRDRDLGMQFDSYAGVYGNTLAFTGRPVGADPGESRFHVIHLDDSSPARPIEAEAGGLVAAGELFAPDSFAAVAVRNRRLYAVTGDPWHTLAEHELPRDALRIAFHDPMHGVAIGRDLRFAWVTEDGAETWSALALPIDGDPASVTVSNQRGADLWCGIYGCVLGGRVIWGPRREPATTVLAATHAPMPSPPRAYFERLRAMTPSAGIEPTRFECRIADDVVARAQALQTASAPASTSGRVYGSGGWLEEQPDPAAAANTASTTVLDWGGVDDRGSFTARGRPITLPAFPEEDGDTMEDVRFVPRSLHRDFAIVQRCAMIRSSTSWSRGLPNCHEIVLVPTRSAAVVIGDEKTLLPGRREYSTGLRDVLPLPDGAVGLRLSNSFWLVSDRDLVLRVSRRGVITHRRAYAWGHHPHASMLARIGSELGLVVASTEAPRTLVFHALDPHVPPRPFAELARRAFDACADRRPNATTERVYLPSGGAYGPVISLGGYDRDTVSFRATMEVNSTGAACVRDFTSWTQHPAFPLERALAAMVGGALHARARGDQIVFQTVDRGREEPFDCTRP